MEKKQVFVVLPQIQDVREFVSLLSQSPREYELSSGRYRVDAKSMMGLFSINLTGELQLTAADGADISDLGLEVPGLRKYLRVR